MKIISFNEDDATIQKILKHCGKWKESIPRPPPQISVEPTSVAEDVILDYDFTFDKCYIEPVEMLSAGLEQNCI